MLSSWVNKETAGLQLFPNGGGDFASFEIKLFLVFCLLITEWLFLNIPNFLWMFLLLTASVLMGNFLF